MKRALFAGVLVLATTATHAEDLVSGLSQDQIQITSNYTGTDIVVFGAIENAANTVGPHDIVVVVRGPDTTMIVRAKKHVAGIWVNANRVLLNGMPSYYYLASTRPVAAIVPAISCPGTCGNRTSGSCPCQPCQSLRHSPVDSTATTTPAGGQTGSAMDTTSGSPPNVW